MICQLYSIFFLFLTQVPYLRIDYFLKFNICLCVMYYNKRDKYTRHEHRQTPTIFYLKLWTFALLFFSLDMKFLGLLVCLWTFKWVGGPLVGDFGWAVFIVESINPKNLDWNLKTFEIRNLKYGNWNSKFEILGLKLIFGNWN